VGDRPILEPSNRRDVAVPPLAIVKAGEGFDAGGAVWTDFANWARGARPNWSAAAEAPQAHGVVVDAARAG